MAIQVLRREKQEPQRMGQGFAEALIGYHKDKQDAAELKEEDERLEKEYGVKFKGIKNPKIRERLVGELQKMKGEESLQEKKQEYLNNLFGNGSNQNPQRNNDQNNANQLRGDRENPQQYGNQLRDANQDQSMNLEEMNSEYNFDPTKVTDEQILRAGAVDKGLENSLIKLKDVGLREKREATNAKDKKQLALRAETTPIRTEIARKGVSAREGIKNKENLINLIDKGDMTDPTIASILENLPFNMGKRLLSNDTVEYKAGIIDEFKDLKNVFPGQVRVKEIEILENKLADIYLNDAQKKAILGSRINALRADVIKSEAAAELESEDKFFGVGQFQNEVEKRAKPKLDALYKHIYEEQKSILQNAENRKKIPLDPKDPDDLNIMMQIKKEAGGDKEKAKALAKKKGYSW